MRRTTHEIEKEVYNSAGITKGEKVIIEVLLDIRDLLASPEVK